MKGWVPHRILVPFHRIAPRAQRLPVIHRPKQHRIASMRLDVVNALTKPTTAHAQWMLSPIHTRCGAPTC